MQLLLGVGPRPLPQSPPLEARLAVGPRLVVSPLVLGALEAWLWRGPSGPRGCSCREVWPRLTPPCLQKVPSCALCGQRLLASVALAGVWCRAWAWGPLSCPEAGLTVCRALRGGSFCEAGEHAAELALRERPADGPGLPAGLLPTAPPPLLPPQHPHGLPAQRQVPRPGSPPKGAGKGATGAWPWGSSQEVTPSLPPRCWAW